MIHPEYSVNYHADTLTTPSDYERDRNMRDLFLSSALFRVISFIIGYAGKTNLAIAMGQLGSEATVPRKLVPFAAFLVSRLSLACISYSCSSHSFLLLAGDGAKDRSKLAGGTGHFGPALSGVLPCRTRTFESNYKILDKIYAFQGEAPLLRGDEPARRKYR